MADVGEMLAARWLRMGGKQPMRGVSGARRLSSMVLYEIEGKGRALVAEGDVASGSTLLQCAPIAKVLKSASDVAACEHCLGPLVSESPFCSTDCASEHLARGGDLFLRCDLRPLHSIHEEQGRKFPLLVAQLVASLLAGLREAGVPPLDWQHALALCHAVIPPEGMPQVEEEHKALLAAFVTAGVSDDRTLELLLPLSRYTQLLGAAQLNAFELHTSRGQVISCLLPSIASCFNHSCEPNMLVSCNGRRARTHPAESVAHASCMLPHRSLASLWQATTSGRIPPVRQAERRTKSRL